MENELITIIDIVKEGKFPGWEKFFIDAREELEEISRILTDIELTTGPYLPYKNNIFKAFETIRPEDVKVVIIGQDPYPSDVACGLSFSVNDGEKIPPSLKTIFKELENSVHGFKPPTSGDLTNWTKEGVLLLNMCLTVDRGKPKSHKRFWMPFIKKALKYVISIRKMNATLKSPKLIFALWGQEAQKIESIIGEGAHYLKCGHPSSMNTKGGFLGCNHFNLINEMLIKMDDKPINWIL